MIKIAYKLKGVVTIEQMESNYRLLSASYKLYCDIIEQENKKFEDQIKEYRKLKVKEEQDRLRGKRRT